MNQLHAIIAFQNPLQAVPFLWPFLGALVALIMPRHFMRGAILSFLWVGIAFSCALFLNLVRKFSLEGISFAEITLVLGPLFLLTGMLVRCGERTASFLRSSYVIEFLCVGLAANIIRLPGSGENIVIIGLMIALSIISLVFVSKEMVTSWSFIFPSILGFILLIAAQLGADDNVISSLLFCAAVVVLLISYALCFPFLGRDENYLSVCVIFSTMMVVFHTQDHLASVFTIAGLTISFVTLACAGLAAFLDKGRQQIFTLLFLPFLSFMALSFDCKVASLLFLFGMCLAWGLDCRRGWMVMTNMALPLGLPFVALLLMLSTVVVHSPFMAYGLIAIVCLFIWSQRISDVGHPYYWLQWPQKPQDMFACALQVLVGICCPVGMMMGLL